MSLGVVADANIMSRIRQMKAGKIADLIFECNSIERTISDYQFAHIVPEDRKPKRKSVRVSFPTREKKREAIDDMRAKLDKSHHDLDSAKTDNIALFIPRFSTPFYVGQIGQLGPLGSLGDKIDSGNQCFHILTIVDESNAIANFLISVSYSAPYRRESRESQHLVGIPGPLVDEHIHKKVVWLRGIKTAGLTDSSNVSPSLYMIITGTQDYHAPIGSKETVFVFEPLEFPGNLHTL